MLFDWINCILEFTIMLIVFLMLAQPKLMKKHMFIYALLSAFWATITVLVNLPLLANMLIFLTFPIITFFSSFKKDYLIFFLMSMLIIIYLQFMCYSILPLSLLQTNLGNFLVNILVFVLVSIVYFFFNKYQIYEYIAPPLLRHKYVVLGITLFTSLLGQIYLSRLSFFWTYLPGVVALAIIIIVSVVLLMYIHYARSSDRLQVALLSKNIANIETYVTNLRIQNHDYKHHLRNLKNQVNTSTDLATLQRDFNSYVDQLTDDQNLITSILNLNQPVLRAAIYGCYTQCMQENIEFNFSSTALLPAFPIKDYQLVQILENLTSNAIEQTITQNIDNRKIVFSLFCENGINKISITNPTDNSTLSLDEMVISGNTTKDSKHHGLGLSSIKQIVEQNNLSFYGKIENNSLTFTLSYKEPTK